MVASATYAPYGSLDSYMKLGYVPVDHDDEAASKTMEYAFDDWTIARTAAAMGRKDAADTFTKRAGYWRNNFNVRDGFVEPRMADGTYRKPFDPARAGGEAGVRAEVGRRDQAGLACRRAGYPRCSLVGPAKRAAARCRLDQRS